jgi:hypothetical protein
MIVCSKNGKKKRIDFEKEENINPKDLIFI